MSKPTDPQPKPSFSLARRLGIGLQVFFLIAVVLSVVVMVNYISRDYFVRFHTSARTRIELSPLTHNLLRSLTNDVRITLYYDKKDPLFSTVSDLVQQYRLQNPQHVEVKVVDYLLDAGTAQRTKEEYHLGATTNLIIFDCAGNVQPIPGNSLPDYKYDFPPNGKIERKFVTFRGETAFTAALLCVTEAKALHAYVLQGHGEHDIASGDDETGYLKFASVLQLYHIEVHRLDNLAMLDGVPTNCDLLIIPGPQVPLAKGELDKIDQYLNRSGSRVLAMLDATALRRPTGLERLLANWGVKVYDKVAVDPEHTPPGADVMVVSAFGIHPAVNPIYNNGICLVRPRPVGLLDRRTQPVDGLHIQVLAQTGPGAYLEGDEHHKQEYPLMVAVEKSIQGVATDRGPTRLLVMGDSYCLANNCLDLLYNRTLAVCAVNWLTDRGYLVQIPPTPQAEYTLFMDKTQMQSTQLILLAGMPGGVLFLGFLVWLRRRR